jgi:serine phosphatase RsbU (regulator of sigma subunit)
MEDPKPFRAEDRVLEEGDMLYLTTDGFADQFGGSGNRKLTTKRMLEWFVKVRHLPLDEQKEELYAYYLAWKGDRVQIDDVSVIGVRI